MRKQIHEVNPTEIECRHYEYGRSAEDIQEATVISARCSCDLYLYNLKMCSLVCVDANELMFVRRR
jgi:hypothetical protein